jgi:hypothetical protein
MSILIGAVPSAPAKTMIVELPDTSCNGASSSPKKGKMASARSAIDLHPVLKFLASSCSH